MWNISSREMIEMLNTCMEMAFVCRFSIQCEGFTFEFDMLENFEFRILKNFAFQM